MPRLQTALKIGAVASAVLLVAGYLGYQTFAPGFFGSTKAAFKPIGTSIGTVVGGGPTTAKEPPASEAKSEPPATPE